MRTIARWLGCVFAAGLTGCSLYPIPDDVISINTEDIARHARCEIRSAIIDIVIEQGFDDGRGALLATEDQVIAFVKAALAKAKKLENLGQSEKAKRFSKSEKDILTLANVAAVYIFDFNIIENDNANGSAAFKLPFTAPKVLDLGANASLNLTRQGQRNFSAQDKWGDLITKPERCRDVRPQRGNIVYPLDGSIGVGRVVKTFVDIANQGGAKDSFVDTLIFTTQIGGGANASIKLDAVPHSLRLVSATAGLNASRVDIHKMVLSLVFPRPDKPEAITGVERRPGDLNAPFQRPPEWRARYNLCVADARQREDTLKLLRLEAPEVYCITYADAFDPQYGGSQGSKNVTVTLESQPQIRPRTTEETPPPPEGRPQPPPPSRVPNVRPNRL
jgi:hypothetical protein